MTSRKREAARPLRNPFEYGRELGRDELVDRKDELRQVVRSLENIGKLFLIGPRRYGKTSLLGAAASVAEDGGTLVLRYDAERYESLDLLAAAVLSGATRRLASTTERAGALLARVASALRPEVAYDIKEQSVSVSLGAAKDATGNALPVLVDVLDAIERMAEATERPVVVILDEFQHVIKQGGEHAERQIRAAVQTHRRVGYVFAGSATRMLADMTSDPGRAFYKLGARLFLGLIPRDEFTAFLRGGFEHAGFTVDDAALVRILDLTHDVPYSVQRLAHECWECLRVNAAEMTAGDATHLTVDQVERALVRVLRQEDAAYTQIWNSLKLQQKRALKAAVVEDGRSLLSSDVSRRHKVPTGSMQKALAALDELGIVREESVAGAVRYVLEDPLLGRWLRWSQQLAAS
jgi:hypothetical protein